MLLTKLGPVMGPMVMRGMMLMAETGTDTPSISNEIVSTLTSSVTLMVHDSLIGFSGVLTACTPLLAVFIVLKIMLKAINRITAKVS